MNSPVRAAIYARISQDRSAEAAGVDRQVTLCRKKAKELGWPVLEAYQDNDTSAYSRKPRPAYRRMLEDIRAGDINAVVAWHPDRLYRRLQDLADFVDLCQEYSVQVDTVQTGRVDLATPSGRMMAGILGVSARYESDHKAERVAAAMEQRAHAGLYHGGRRPFGYESDGQTVRPDEAAVIEDLAQRFLAGEGLVSLVNWLNQEDVPTVGGGPWQVSSLRQMIGSPRISGQVVRHGEIIGPAQWPAIITEGQTQGIRAILDDPGRRQQRTARRYLLSGLLRCSHCGMPLVGDNKPDGARYSCRRSPKRPDACQGTSIKAAPVEYLISEAVLQRLSGGINLAKTPRTSSAIVDEAAALQTLDMLADMLGEGTMTRKQYERAAGRASERLKRARAISPQDTRVEVLSMWAKKGSDLRGAWPDLSLTRQAAIVRALIDHCVILPAQSGAREVDPSRVRAVWRV